MAEKKLEVKNLQVSFRTQGGILKAVRGITFDLYKGETLAIVGESGSGKSVTSKAIIGILSGNSIVEGGEILYDGADLLKISEDDFHKIRGDKISMIFQDPLSSLNPIMRVGRQLTEAMILNGKARQKHARVNFNSHLKLLNKNLNEVEKDVARNKEMCTTFDNFCINSTKLEKAYNEANNQAVSLLTEIDEFTFLVEKHQKVDVKKTLGKFIKFLPKTIHKSVVKNGDELMELVNVLKGFKIQGKKANLDDVVSALNKVSDILKVGINNPKPDYFRLGFYKMKNPDFDESTYKVDELDAMTREYLDKEFMLEFIELGKKGMKNSHDKALEKKHEAMKLLVELRNYIAESKDLDKKVLKQMFKATHNAVEAAIDKLSVHKYSVEYSFGISLRHECLWYYQGLARNPKNQHKYDVRKAKWDALTAKGKQPSWQVIPPYIIDLELTRNNMLKIIDSLVARYEAAFEEDKGSYDSEKEMIDLVDFLKEHAHRVVHKITQGIAKAKALELLKEVGIPEPQIRYKQYPFEFSGGMRQRIVIAIALSANPDILICDEPTTALDVTIQSQILELINKIKEERKLSVIFITHDLGVVANMADRIAVMYAGKIVEYGTADDVFYDPRHPYTWALLASMPDLDTKEKLEAIPGTPPNMIYPPKGDAFAERNKYALEIDYELDPPLFQVEGSDTHFAATWLLHPNAPKVNPPSIIQDRIERMKKEASKL